MTEKKASPARKPATKKAEEPKSTAQAEKSEEQIKAEAEEATEETQEDKPQPKAPAKKAEKEHVPTVDSIDKKYDELLDELGAFIVEKRRKGTHVNFYNRHLRQVELDRRNFNKFARR